MIKDPGNRDIEILIIGHITQDLTPAGPRLGGTAAYSALLYHRLDWKVGVVTSLEGGRDLGPLHDIPMVIVPAQDTTTFTNQTTPQGRKQVVYKTANQITLEDIPPAWRGAALVHLAPVLNEFKPALGESFPGAYLGYSLQGWLRARTENGEIRPAPLPPFLPAHPHGAVVSVEDLGTNFDQLPDLRERFSTLVLTRGRNGATLYTAQASQPIPTRPRQELDPTGAGDIFAAAFFNASLRHHRPKQAADWATLLAAQSVTKPGLAGVPRASEIPSLPKVH